VTTRKDRKPIRSPIKAIRAFCVECMGDNVREVKYCTSPECWLFPFRFGRNPFRVVTRGQVRAGEAAAKRLNAQARAEKDGQGGPQVDRGDAEGE
jgi:hypothetical protein